MEGKKCNSAFLVKIDYSRSKTDSRSTRYYSNEANDIRSKLMEKLFEGVDQTEFNEDQNKNLNDNLIFLKLFLNTSRGQ